MLGAIPQYMLDQSKLYYVRNFYFDFHVSYAYVFAQYAVVAVTVRRAGDSVIAQSGYSATREQAMTEFKKQWLAAG